MRNSTRALERMSAEELLRIEEALLASVTERDALAAKLSLYGVRRMDKIEFHLEKIQAVLAEKAFLAKRKGTPAPPTPKEVASTVRGAREVMGLTQAEFGRRMGVSALTVIRWERGKTSMRLTAWNLLLRIVEEARVEKA